MQLYVSNIYYNFQILTKFGKCWINFEEFPGIGFSESLIDILGLLSAELETAMRTEGHVGGYKCFF
jgi:hypothetical protein